MAKANVAPKVPAKVAPKAKAPKLALVKAAPVKAPRAPTLKVQREECMSFLNEQTRDARTWLDSALLRYHRHKNPLANMIQDLRGAKTAVHCTLREAMEKWPAFFDEETLVNYSEYDKKAIKAVADYHATKAKVAG